MKVFALLSLSFIGTLSWLSAVLCLPGSFDSSPQQLSARSLELSQSQLYKRSPAPRGSLCLESGRLAARSRRVSKGDEEEIQAACSDAKSVDVYEKDESSHSQLSTRSLESTESQLTKRSPTPRGSLCLESGRLVARSRRVSKGDEEETQATCFDSKSVDVYEKDESSHSSHRGAIRRRQISSSTHSSSSKLSESRPPHSLSERSSSKSNYLLKGDKSWGHHSYKYKPHRFNSKFLPGGSYASTTSSESVTESSGSTSVSGGWGNDAQNMWNNFGIPPFNAGGPGGFLGNFWNNLDNSMSPNPANPGHDPSLDDSNAYHGKATFFRQGGNPGACGKVHADSDFIVAIQSKMYSGGKHCGKTVMVTRKSTGKTIKCIAADECPGCPTHQSLDLSIGAFNALGSPDEGVFDIQWTVLD